MKNSLKSFAIFSICLTALFFADSADARDKQAKPLLAVNTKKFEFKEGFEKRRKDIVNTLKDNEVTRFQTFLEGLEQSYGLTDIIRGNGPFTVFAPSDKAWDAMPADDRASLFANRKKLHQVLKYMFVKGTYKYDDLKSPTSLKTLEGGSISIQMRRGDLWADKALVTTADVLCTNGVIHVIDTVIMPKLED
ncbi:MAG: fasciclin domain-containing protein [Cyanobacteria bacterium]|nr:fasciclin domain-containing protein [Cyanobacteriota bacterium]